MSKPSNSLKIGLVVDDTLDKTDGVQQYVIGVAEWLRSQGHDVHYLAGETKRTDLKNIHSLSRNIHVRFNGNRLSVPLPTSRRKLRAFLKAQNFDVLHVQIPYSPFLAARIIKASGPKTAVFGTFHILPHTSFVRFTSHLLGWWLHSSLKRFDQIVSVSSAAQIFAQKSFGITSTVLPNVFDYQTFHTAKPLKQYADDVKTIMFLGRLVPRKGCQVLLEAITILSKQSDLPDFRVIICGKGPLADKLQAYINTHNLSKYVTLVGFVSEEDKPRYYASSDITVFPSNGGESFGIVLLEAMASGNAAVLAGDNPGYRSVMEPRTELLFDPNDAAVLAKKLHSYLTNDKLRSEAQNWGKTYVTAFDTQVIGEKIIKAYDKALLKRAQG